MHAYFFSLKIVSYTRFIFHNKNPQINYKKMREETKKIQNDPRIFFEFSNINKGFDLSNIKIKITKIKWNVSEV